MEKIVVLGMLLSDFCIFIFDLDGDGDFDIFVFYEGENKIIWYENFGGGIFSVE